MTAYGTYMAGSSHGGLVKWGAMAVKMNEPLADPIQYSDPIEMGDGTTLNRGWLEQTLHWDILTEAEANQVRALCGNVNILTPKNDGFLGEYTGVMKWPDQEPEHRSNNVKDLSVKVIKLTPYV